MVNIEPQTLPYLEASTYEERGWSEEQAWQRGKDIKRKEKYTWAFSWLVGKMN